ncbi:MAG TPA: D-glycero-beta-D-manno-heptose-7-phosphate kinase [Bacillota bacterium]|nr:D-glycero-beta-D-manno-heptose-7-phosphate kinase [Bacillota bacterium]
MNDRAAVAQFLVEKIFECRILVIGDIMLDRYFYASVQRISPEAPVPIAKVERQNETLGGAANVAHNLARLGCQVELLGMAGEDENRQTLIKLLEAQAIGHRGIVVTNRPTTTKLRVIGGHQQMLRLDFEDAGPVAANNLRKLKTVFDEQLGQVQAVIISDYAKGICTNEFCQYIIKQCLNKAISVIIDPKGVNWRKYRGANFITPNLKELNEVAALRKTVINEDLPVKTAAELVRKRYGLGNVVVTRSEKGFSLINHETAVHVPTHAREVFDVSGAGDTFIAVLGAAVGAGLEATDAARLANLAAGVVVGRAGTYAISREELLNAYETVE